ncbi:unnamed protein product, partial [Phaeothamnion confervicola]
LNALVDASVARTEQQRCNVAFIKTHKTASTTLASILYRYGARHDKAIAQFSRRGTTVDLPLGITDVENGNAPRPDIIHYHHVWDGNLKKDTWAGVRQKYLKVCTKEMSV